MKQTIESILFGFREILTWHTMKYALITGLLVMSLWISLGVLFWESLSSLSMTLIGFLPLNLMISDGTWMLSTFIWLMVVLLSFALIYIFLGNFILTKISKNKYGSFSYILMVISALFWILIWYLNGDMINQEITNFLKTLPYTTVEYGLAYLFTIYIIYNAIVISMLFIVNIFNKPLIQHLSTKHYDGELEQHHTLQAFRYTLKDTLLFITISLFAFPLLFIPIVNFIAQITLWMWLTKDTLQYNTASLVFDEVKNEELKKYRVDVWFISFVTVLFNFIPIFNIFAPFFGEISMFHYWKKIQEER
jgi:hypothetical protein